MTRRPAAVRGCPRRRPIAAVAGRGSPPDTASIVRRTPAPTVDERRRSPFGVVQPRPRSERKRSWADEAPRFGQVRPETDEHHRSTIDPQWTITNATRLASAYCCGNRHRQYAPKRMMALHRAPTRPAVDRSAQHIGVAGLAAGPRTARPTARCSLRPAAMPPRFATWRSRCGSRRRRSLDRAGRQATLRPRLDIRRERSVHRMAAASARPGNRSWPGVLVGLRCRIRGVIESVGGASR
jgi:hypothetical protein